MVDSMKNVLFTGGSGFIGRNVINGLKEFCYIFAPTREELNLLDCDAVKKYIIDNKIQVVINSANPNPVKNQLDKKEKDYNERIRILSSLYYRLSFQCAKLRHEKENKTLNSSLLKNSYTLIYFLFFFSETCVL